MDNSTSTVKRRQAGSRSKKTAAVAAASVIGGTALTAYGIMRRNWSGAMLAAGGAYLAYTGLNDATRPYTGRVRIGYTIGKTPEEIYGFVRDPANWPSFLQGLVIEAGDDDSVTLKFGKPGDEKVVCKARVTDEARGKFIAWSSGAELLQHRGVIHFRPAPGERGTDISVALEFKAPGGPLARAMAKLMGSDPEQVVRESLRRLKQTLEAGEVPTTKNQSAGSRGTKGAALRVLYHEVTAEPSAKSRIAGD